MIELQKKLKIKNMKIEERTSNIRDIKDVVDEGVAVEEEEVKNVSSKTYEKFMPLN